MLILVGCDPADLGELSELNRLGTLVVNDSSLNDLSPVARMLLRAGFIPRNMVQGLDPLLRLPHLIRVDVTGNLLSETSYQAIIPELVPKGTSTYAAPTSSNGESPPACILRQFL
ncbi:hypothetical protein [Micromonospora sp. NPDC048830]|uniref:hypothetical protein n=1 Tax=Micromonospora sp. NPDC048830 TaxID=3364257 RepID=UPI00371459CD